MPTPDEENMHFALAHRGAKATELVNQLENENKVLNGRIAELEKAAESRHGKMVSYLKALGANIESIKRRLGPQPNEEKKMKVKTSTTKRAAEKENQTFQVVAKKRPTKQRKAQASCSNSSSSPLLGSSDPPEAFQDPPVVLRKQERWGQISKGLSVAKIGYTKAKMVPPFR